LHKTRLTSLDQARDQIFVIVKRLRACSATLTQVRKQKNKKLQIVSSPSFAKQKRSASFWFN
jgi:hypothetical protein